LTVQQTMVRSSNLGVGNQIYVEGGKVKFVLVDTRAPARLY